MATDRIAAADVGVEVDELHVDHPDDAASFSDGHLQLPTQQQQPHHQSDSMRNLLIVESAGRSTAFIVEATVTIGLAACLLVLSLASVIVVPLMYSDPEERYPISADLHNCGAYGVWLPFLAVACGTLMLKASHTGQPRYFSMFYWLCLVTTGCCAAVIVLRSLYYAYGLYRPLIDQTTLHSKRQFSIQIACDSLCLALLIEGSILLCVYLKLFCRQSCLGSPRLRRDSDDNRNMFV